MNSTSDQPVWSEEADRELQAAVKLHGNDSRKIKTHLKNLVQVKAVDIKKRLLFLQQPVQQEQAKVEKPKPILKAIEKLAQKPFIKNVPPTPSLNAALKAGRVSKFSSSLSSQIEKSNVDISNRPKVSTIISAINTKNQFPTPAVIPALPPQFKHSKPFVNSPTIRRPEISNLSSSRATKRVFQGDDLPRSDAPLMKMPRDAKRRSTRFTGIRQNVFVKEDGVSRNIAKKIKLDEMNVVESLVVESVVVESTVVESAIVEDLIAPTVGLFENKSEIETVQVEPVESKNVHVFSVPLPVPKTVQVEESAPTPIRQQTEKFSTPLEKPISKKFSTPYSSSTPRVRSSLRNQVVIPEKYPKDLKVGIAWTPLKMAEGFIDDELEDLENDLFVEENEITWIEKLWMGVKFF